MNRSRWMLFLMGILLALCGLILSPACSCDDDDDDDDDAVDDDDTEDDDDDSDDDDTDDDDDTQDDDDDDASDPFCDTLDDFVEAGKAYLIAGIPEMARMAFECELAVDPEDPDAHYGVMLSGGLHLWEVVALVSMMIADHESGHGDFDKDIDPDRDLLRSLLALITEGYFHPAGENVREHYQWLTENDDPELTVDGIPVFWELHVAALLGSNYGLAEKEGCLAVGNIFDGLTGTLISLEIDLNLFTQMQLEFGGEAIDVIVQIVYLIDDILNDPAYPDTLRIDPDYMDRVADSRLYMGTGFIGLKKALDETRLRGSGQDVYALSYVDENSNGQYDDGEPITFGDMDPLEGEDLKLLNAIAAVLYDLGAAFLDRTELDVDPDNPNPFNLDSLNAILNAIGWPSLIPGFITIDIADVYENLEPDSIRDFLQTLVNLLKLFLPAPAAA